MSQIKISALSPAGSELFQDAESFLQDLAPSDLQDVAGGLADVVGLSIVVHPVLSLQYYSGVVQTNVTVSVAIGFQTASILSIAH
ncbi:hypothetical protein LEP3755_36240 [Leptolyngbya sp. NIES-3755]|nr:hypothetical protein LEP3755_36240 [Leptolyngbya sp. NIES-3755]